MIDEARFRIFYEQTSRPLLAYLVRITGEKAMADDVFQESYVRMLQSDLQEPTEANLKSYLFTTATNLARDHWRRAKKSVRWESEETGAVAMERTEEQADLRHDLGEALEGCSPQQRSLLWLAYVEGYHHNEIAAMLNLREKSVKVLLFRARHKLKEALAANETGGLQ